MVGCQLRQTLPWNNTLEQWKISSTHVGRKSKKLCNPDSFHHSLLDLPSIHSPRHIEISSSTVSWMFVPMTESRQNNSFFILDFLSKSTWGVFALPPLIWIFLPPIKPTLFSTFAGEQFYRPWPVPLVITINNIITFLPNMSQFWFLIDFVFKIFVVWKLKANDKTASKRILEAATKVQGEQGDHFTYLPEERKMFLFVNNGFPYHHTWASTTGRCHILSPDNLISQVVEHKPCHLVFS